MKSFVTHTTAQPTVESLTDYYPFGMAMPGRSYNATDYRFGYTGHEQEGDLAEGVYTTQYRLLDTRLGRWMSVDPLFGKYPDMGAYNYCAGNPVGCWNPDGRYVFNDVKQYPPLTQRQKQELVNKYGLRERVSDKYEEKRKSNQFLYQYAENMRGTDNDKVFYYAAHGNPYSVETNDKDNPTFNTKNIQSFIDYINETLKLFGDAPYDHIEDFPIVVLYSCQTGSKTDGFAAKLSGKTNHIVIAPSENVSASASGSATVESRNGDRGYWNVYYKGILVDQYNGLPGKWYEFNIPNAVEMPSLMENFDPSKKMEEYELKIKSNGTNP